MSIILIGALAIGLSLGMLGSGGSAITVPVLVYLLGHGAKESIAESMAIVGMISIVAAVPYAKSHQIDWRSVLYFGVPGMFGTFVGAWLGGLALAAVQLLVFGVVLLVSSVAMLKPLQAPRTGQSAKEIPHASPVWIVGSEGLLLGLLTGFVGVGGGFLIVPALVVLGKLPIRLAIGTSLMIIAINTAVGFVKYEHYLLAHELSVNWQTISIFTLIGMLGSMIGRSINTRLDQQLLKTVFAGLLILVGGFVIFSEGRKLWRSPPAVGTVAAQADLFSTNIVSGETPCS